MSVMAVPGESPSQARADEVGARTIRQRLALSSRVYLPAFSILAVAVALVWIGWSRHFGGAGFAASVTNLRVIVIGPISLAAIGVFLVAERVRPAQRRPLIARGHRHDVLFTVFNATFVV